MPQETKLFAIQQKYDFSSKSQHQPVSPLSPFCCLQYSKSTIFQANHNRVRAALFLLVLFAIQQKYDFSSKSQPYLSQSLIDSSCLQYSKSTIFQANHNENSARVSRKAVVCNTAKVRFFKQITTLKDPKGFRASCLQYSKSTIFQANHNATSL